MDPESDRAFPSRPEASMSEYLSSNGTRYSVGQCPVCGGGLCGIRAYTGDDNSITHGLIVCDECEAIWLQPNLEGVHVYTDAESPASPISGQPLYGEGSRWATPDDIEGLGWTSAINPELTYDPSGSDSSDGESQGNR